MRGVLRKLWDAFGQGSAPSIRSGPLLLSINTLALRLQYQERCDISFVDGAWEYRWPDATIISPRVILQWARPEQFGLEVGGRLEDAYCFEYLPKLAISLLMSAPAWAVSSSPSLALSARAAECSPSKRIRGPLA